MTRLGSVVRTWSKHKPNASKQPESRMFLPFTQMNNWEIKYLKGRKEKGPFLPFLLKCCLHLASSLFSVFYLKNNISIWPSICLHTQDTGCVFFPPRCLESPETKPEKRSAFSWNVRTSKYQLHLSCYSATVRKTLSRRTAGLSDSQHSAKSFQTLQCSSFYPN